MIAAAGDQSNGNLKRRARQKPLGLYEHSALRFGPGDGVVGQARFTLRIAWNPRSPQDDHMAKLPVLGAQGRTNDQYWQVVRALRG